jgi:hypothetical protein
MIRFAEGVIELRGRDYPFPSLPEFMIEILSDGGLIPHLSKTLHKS